LNDFVILIHCSIYVNTSNYVNVYKSLHYSDLIEAIDYPY